MRRCCLVSHGSHGHDFPSTKEADSKPADPFSSALVFNPAVGRGRAVGKVCLTDAASARPVRPVFTQSVNTSHSLGGMEVPTLLAEQAGLAQRQTGATLLKAWLCPRTLRPGRQGPPGALWFLRFGVGFFLHLPIKPC